MVQILNCYLYAKKSYGTLSKGAIVFWPTPKMFIFPEENSTGLSPVPIHQFSPLYIFKVTDIALNLARMQCKQSNFV